MEVVAARDNASCFTKRQKDATKLPTIDQEGMIEQHEGA